MLKGNKKSELKDKNKTYINKINHEKWQKTAAWMNRYSLLLHVILSCGVCFLIEWISRHSFMEACEFVTNRNLVFLYNSLIVYASLLLVYFSRRRVVFRALISVFWLFLGTINGCILAKRVSPFSFTDLKMVSDLFTMQSNYFTITEAVLVVVAVLAVLCGLVVLWIKGPKYKGNVAHVRDFALVCIMALMLPRVTSAAVDHNILTSYFENLAQGYKDYGFIYSFSASVIDRGMSTPEDYSVEAVHNVLDIMNGATLERQDAVSTTSDGQSTETESEIKNEIDTSDDCKAAAATAAATLFSNAENKIPENSSEDINIVCVLLESFVDPGEIKFLQTDIDPVPNFHYLKDHFTSGYLTVPVVGAGTANTEFEVLTGMGMHFFGLGEYPYKTILKKTNCESIASDLHQIGYGTHVIHDNGANFYSRKNAFSQMGFDTFTSKEMLNIQKYTPLGTWPQDDIMLDSVTKSLNLTPDQPDFAYIITVETHGDYPKYQILEDPAVKVTGVEDEGMGYAWEYYVNQVHEMDDFIGELITLFSKRDEKTLVVMFGDHLPTMGLTSDDMVSGSLFKTHYITWNNFGLEKQDQELTSYQLLAQTLDSAGIHEGTMFRFHQNKDKYQGDDYQDAMRLLQYDILYGNHYVYNGENPYPASDLVMGTDDIIIHKIIAGKDCYYITGENFTKWSKVFINGSKVSTTALSGKLLKIKKSEMKSGTYEVMVQQMGSSDTVLRSSEPYEYQIVNNAETEAQTETQKDQDEKEE